jgi:hypothetical protein
VFDTTLRNDLLRRFGDRPNWERPGYYEIATLPERAAQREWVNSALSLLPVQGSTQMFRRLASRRGFGATYNEIAVAAILQSAGLLPEYEAKFGDLTPDLCVRRADGESALIVEVVGRFLPDATHGEVRLWHSFANRVEQITVPVGLVVHFHDGGIVPPPVGAHAKRIVAILQDALIRNGGSLGPIEIENYVFCAVDRVPGTRAKLVPPVTPGWEGSDGLLETIHSKVKKYGPIAAKAGTPLVVALAAGVNVPVGIDLLRSALAGAQSTVISFSPFGGPTQIGSTTVKLREKDVSMDFHAGLSAVAWLQAGIDDPGTLTVFSIPSAALPHGLPLGDRIISD